MPSLKEAKASNDVIFFAQTCSNEARFISLIPAVSINTSIWMCVVLCMPLCHLQLRACQSHHACEVCRCCVGVVVTGATVHVSFFLWQSSARRFHHCSMTTCSSLLHVSCVFSVVSNLGLAGNSWLQEIITVALGLAEVGDYHATTANGLRVQKAGKRKHECYLDVAIQ